MVLETKLKLSVARQNLIAATVGNLVIFAGGENENNDFDTIDIFVYENGKLSTVDTQLKLSEKRDNLVAATVGNSVIFAGGKTGSGSYSKTIDVFYPTPPIFNKLNSLPPEKDKFLQKTTVTPIKNETQGLIFQRQSQAVSYLGEAFPLTRLTTSTIQQFSQTLFAKGLDGLLSLDSQKIHESDFPDVTNNQLDFDGAYGAYFWEIFFHIPFLIGSTLNAHQRYNEARQWYQYIFNPTISEKDKFWRFLPFQSL
ncbi:MAG: hypothetical protein AAF063_29645 [Cyanobacteria bacterium J06643_5]